MMHEDRHDPDTTRGDDKDESATRWACYHVLAMVFELHLRGYERIRACPSLSGSGGYWRCSITPADHVTANGLVIVDTERGAHYTSGTADHYFGWTDQSCAGPGTLAQVFLGRFPEIAAAGHGPDPDYATWFAELLGHAARGQFPIALADFELPADRLAFIPGPGAASKQVTMPLPPPPAERSTA